MNKFSGIYQQILMLYSVVVIIHGNCLLEGNTCIRPVTNSFCFRSSPAKYISLCKRRALRVYYTNALTEVRENDDDDDDDLKQTVK